jgi:hypothetical protein
MNNEQKMCEILDKSRTSATLRTIPLVAGLCFTLFVSAPAFAQYGGGGSTGSGGSGGTYTPPKGGCSSATGAAIGAGAAAGVGGLLLALHYHGLVTGCVQPTEDGLRLVSEKKNISYTLLSGKVNLRPGQRVELKGHKSNDQTGAPTFKPQKLLKDLGTCASSSPASTGDRAAQ